MISIESLSTKLEQVKQYTTDIKNAIVTKKGSAVTGHMDTFATEILNLPSVGPEPIVSPIDVVDEGYDESIADELSGIGWASSDIDYYRQYGVTWTVADNASHHVNQATKDFYNTYIIGAETLTIDIIKANCIKWNWCPQFGDKIRIVTNLQGLFGGSPWYGMPALDFSNVINQQYAFSYCTELTCMPRHTYCENTTKNKSGCNSFCKGCSSLTHVDYVYVPAGSAQNMFSDCSKLVTVNSFNFHGSGETKQVFYKCASLKTLNYDSGSDFNSANALTGMFSGCTSLESVTLYLGINVTQIGSIFQDCVSLRNVTILPSPGHSISECTKLVTCSGMFLNCHNLLEIPALEFPNSTTYSGILLYSTSNINPNWPRIKKVGAIDMSSITVSSKATIFNNASSGAVMSFNALPNLTDLGPLRNLSVSLDLSNLIALNKESVLGIINALNDSCTGQILTFGVSLDDEDIVEAIETKVNWTITTTYT